jgi:alanine racemase
MNLCCCQLPEPAKIGDQIWLIEDKKDSPLSVQAIAELAGTIPYEVLVKLERGVRREVING